MKLFSFILSVLLCLSLISCASAEKQTAEILRELTEDCEELPKGIIYTRCAEEGEEGYMSPSLACALYGARAEEYFLLLEDYSIYLSSFATPYEIAVLRCYSSSDARKIEGMCRERADIVAVALRHTDFYGLCENIRIIREGETVVFLMTDDPERTARIAKRLI